MNTVLIPCYKRPEYLKVCLDLIQKADGWKDMLYIFSLDYGHDPMNEEIIRKVEGMKSAIIRIKTRNYTITKQSFAVLNGLANAVKCSSDLVYYIEDDVFIGKDFFRYHAEVLKDKAVTVSIGSVNHNSKFITTEDLNSYYISDRGDYQGIGSCWRKEDLFKYVLPHLNNNYLNAPQHYCKALFPDSIIGLSYVEQDGLIRRILEKEKLRPAFPHVPRCFHAGLYGYNRRNPMQFKPFADKLKFVQAVSFNKGSMAANDKLKNGDSVPVPLNTDFKGELKNVSCPV